jgi:hypothetical protein
MMMEKIQACIQSENGRRMITVALIVLSALAQGGVIPIDYAIPGFGLTTGELLGYAGVATAATAGSSTRK